MSTRPLAPVNFIAPLVTACSIAALYLMPETLAHRDVLRGVLYFVLAGAAVQTLDQWVLAPLVRRLHMPGLFHTILKLAVAFAACFTLLRSLYDIDLMPLLTTSAVLSFVLGLALQDTLANLFAGITINIEKPYKVGDWICTGGVDAKVVEVTWRTTKLLTNDNNFLIVPNNNISKETIVNYSAPEPISALWIEIDLEYEIPPNKARAVILETLRTMPDLPRVREPEVQMRNFAESSITYGVRIWLDDWTRKNRIASDVRTHLWYAIERAGMAIPFPRRDMIMHRPPPPPPPVCIEALELLRHSPIFSGLEESLLQALAKAMRKGLHAAGSRLFLEGDHGDSLFVVQEGRLSVHKGELRIAELGRGALLGEMSLLTGAPRSATIKAECDTVCLELSKADFARLAGQSPRLLEELGEIITRRQLNTREALEKARAETGASEAEAHGVFKSRLVSLMKGFLGVGQRRG